MTPVVSTSAERGSLFTRSAIAVALGGGVNVEAARHAADRWPDSPRVALTLEKAATAGMSTGNAEALAMPGTAEFLAMLRPRTILGRLSRLRRVPVNRSATLATGGAAYTWIGEGAPTPVGRLTFEAASLPDRKIGGLAVLTKDLLLSSSPAAEALVREELLGGLANFLDVAFTDPSRAGVPDVSPASITNGITSTPSAGDPSRDLRTLLGGFESLDGVAVIASERQAIAFATALPVGSFAGGLLFGVVPVVFSSAVGDNLIAMHAPSILFADDGATELDAAEHATLMMDDAPTNDSVTPTPTNVVSLWQANSVALKVTRWLNWERTNTDAVAVVSGADYIPAE